MKVISLFDGISTGQYCLKQLGIDVETYYASEIDKYAIAITQHNFPNTIQMGDVNKWREWDIDWSTIDLIIGGSPCFVAGTLVMTDKGMKPIEEIKVGDMVLTHNSRYRKVLNVGGKLVDNVYNIKGMGFDTITTTSNHPFYAREKYYQYEDKGMKTKEGWKKKSKVRHYKEPQWVEAKDLDKTKHYLGVTYNTELSEDIDNHSEDFWYFVGRFIGDGWIRKTKRKNRKDSYTYQVTLCCGKSEFDEVKQLMNNLGYTYNYSEERTVYKFRICSMELVDYLSKCGIGAINKCIHPDIWGLPLNKKKALLDGYISADGSYPKNKNGLCSITTISKQLAYELKLLITEVYNVPVGMTYSNRSPKYIIEGREVNQHNTYQIRFKTYTHPQDKSFFDRNMSYVWSQITSITTEEKQTIVYNMEVEEDNSYTANGVVVHNCQNLSNAGNGTGLEGSESSLFFRYLEILNHIKSLNPNVKFLLENVRMKAEWEAIFNEHMGVKPILIDSAVVCAQSRKRLYWTNIPIIGELEKKDVTLKDIVEPVENKAEFNITDKMYAKKEGTLSYKKAWGSVKTLDQKSKTLTCSQSIANSGATNIKYPNGEFYKPTAIESERLQTLPDNYTKYGMLDGSVKEISYTQRVKCVGNGWTADVISYIFNGLK